MSRNIVPATLKYQWFPILDVESFTKDNGDFITHDITAINRKFPWTSIFNENIPKISVSIANFNKVIKTIIISTALSIV